jgi:hypothetical protein
LPLAGFQAAQGAQVKFAYADPPYPGCANLYPEKEEVDHLALVNRLVSDYPDGWALSTGSAQLQYVLGLCPENVRIAAWVKPFANYKPNVNPAYAWEPVIWSGGRKKRARAEVTVADWVAASITLQRGVVGAKPDGFWFWLFSLLGIEEQDEMVDLFPGTGRGTICLQAYKSQLRIKPDDHLEQIVALEANREKKL